MLGKDTYRTRCCPSAFEGRLTFVSLSLSFIYLLGYPAMPAHVLPGKVQPPTPTWQLSLILLLSHGMKRSRDGPGTWGSDLEGWNARLRESAREKKGRGQAARSERPTASGRGESPATTAWDVGQRHRERERERKRGGGWPLDVQRRTSSRREPGLGQLLLHLHGICFGLGLLLLLLWYIAQGAAHGRY